MNKTNLLLAGMISVAMSTSAVQAADPLTAEQKSAVKALVQETLQENPELVIEAIQTWREKQAALEAQQQKQAITELKEELQSTTSPVWGNPDGKTVVVEFSDYNCPYCKRVFTGIQELVDKDGDLKIVMKELPVLGPNSQYAAKAALAADMQGKYFEFHVGMMKASGRLSPEGILGVARKVGLDMERLKNDMEAPAVAMELAKNRMMSEKLGISGTPAFVIGDQLVPGAIDSKRMEALIKQARGG